MECVSKGIKVSVYEGKKKKKSFFGTTDTGKLIPIADPAQRDEIYEKISLLLLNHIYFGAY